MSSGSGSPGLRGVAAACGSAFLFGLSAPLSKVLLDTTSPWMLAALLYLGAGLGLAAYRLVTRAPRVRLPWSDLRWFSGAVLAGGVVAPVLLMLGISQMPATGASLLLNSEAVFTVLLAWLLFGEHVGARLVLGMAAIVAGAVLVTVPGSADLGAGWAPWAVVAACLCWAVDNNLTRHVSDTDPTWIAMTKGLVAGTTNLVLALLLGAQVPVPSTVVLGLLLGFGAFGVSLTLFVVALRHLGTARTGAYFSVAPFIGAVIAVALGEPVTGALIAAGVLMGFGVWLHLSEHHEHEHLHPAFGVGQAAIGHTHPHYPDSEHRHPH
ncbi:MAG TPA: DMT family transporter [Candidatus Limnocylindrales bacterium]|nr:DMT family transporter [Candidatus Limnocylindrales bacterium]